jgi:hypothetical protein
MHPGEAGTGESPDTDVEAKIARLEDDFAFAFRVSEDNAAAAQGYFNENKELAEESARLRALLADHDNRRNRGSCCWRHSLERVVRYLLGLIVSLPPQPPPSRPLSPRRN